MKKLLCALAIAAIVVPGTALAGGGMDCASAVELLPGQPYAGDTSDNQQVVGAFGILPSPGPDAIYKFTSDGQATGSINVTLGFNGALLITSTCNGNAGTPVNSCAAPGDAPGDCSVPVEVAGSGAPLTAGQTYFVVVTGNPADASGPSGTYNFTTPDPLPVSLQSFSID